MVKHSLESQRRYPNRTLLILAFATITYTIITPLTLLILIPSILLRYLAITLAKACRPNDLDEITTGKQTTCAMETPHLDARHNILVYIIMDGPVSLDVIRSEFKRRILDQRDPQNGSLLYRRLRQTWEDYCGFVFWKWDTEFDLENHIRLYDYSDPEHLPSPCTEEDLKQVTGDLLAQPWHKGRSPWELLVIPNLKDPRHPDRTATVLTLRIHHALADGFSILKLLLRLFSGKQEGPMIKAQFPTLSLWQRLLMNLYTLVRMPYDCALTQVDGIDGRNDWHLSTELSGRYHVLFSDEISVEKIKTVARLHGVGYNAVVYGVTAAAVKGLMESAGQQVPDSMSFVFPAPLPDHPDGLVVHTTAVSFKFSPRYDSVEEIVKRLGSKLLDVQRGSTVPISVNWVSNALALLPVWLLRPLYSRWFVSTLLFSSFPGPTEPLNFAGVGVKWSSWIAVLGNPPGNTGVTSLMTSMAGKQRVTLTVDKQIFPKDSVPQNFSKLVNAELEALLSKTGKIHAA